MAASLYDKLFDSHVVGEEEDGTKILYIDRHFLNEVTSPQAFEGLRLTHRQVWRPKASLGVADHNIPTTDRNPATMDSISRKQIAALRENCKESGIEHFGMDDARQGIVHVVGPELGSTLPGTTIVCGDSHTSTHGAFGALAFGIGTSEIEHVLATQTLLMRKSKSMLVTVQGTLPPGCSAKDLALAIIGRIGSSAGNGHAIEFAGAAVRALSMEGRMTLCNMAIEAGARAGMIAVDEVTLDYCRGRPLAPSGDAWQAAVDEWRQLRSDDDAVFDVSFTIDAGDIVPQVTWGTSPDMVVGIGGSVPFPEHETDPQRRAAWSRALQYMGLTAGTRMTDIHIDKVFIGSCTNGRIEDLRAAANVLRALDRPIAANVKLALAVAGSGAVKRQAEAEKLDLVFKKAGFEWREPGCSMCIAMNADRLEAGERVASTSNRNFEGRQGAGGRSHLVSPAMAAAAAVAGHFVDVRDMPR